MPQSDVPSLADAYMQTSPSSPKAKYLWEAFNRAKEYASEARDRTPSPLPMEAESSNKSRRREARDSPATPITPATRRHSPSPEAPRTRRNSDNSYDDRKDPSHPLYQYNYREAYHQHILQTSKDSVMIQPPFFIFHPLLKPLPLRHPRQSLRQHMHSKHQFDASPLPISPYRLRRRLWIYARLVHLAPPSLTSCPS